MHLLLAKLAKKTICAIRGDYNRRWEDQITFCNVINKDGFCRRRGADGKVEEFQLLPTPGKKRDTTLSFDSRKAEFLLMVCGN